jgi:glycosyltransferase involved in cell wall biosynthesis
VRIAMIGGFAPAIVLFRGPLLREMVARGHEVTALAADGNNQVRADLAALGVDFRELRLERTGLSAWRDAGAVWQLAHALRELGPDALFAYTLKPILHASLASCLSAIPIRYAMVTGLGYSFLGQEHLARRALAQGVTALLRLGLRRYQGVFVQNPDDERDLRTRGALPRDLPVHVVRGSGVDVDHYAPCPLPDEVRFLFIGRLLREKGIHDFVAAARLVRAQHPRTRFTVVGAVDSNPASASQDELAQWQREGVIDYVGEVRDVRPQVAAASVLVLPSYREGTPRAVLEAMSMGRAILTTDVPGCRHTIVDGEHGLLVPARDPAALAAAMTTLLADPEKVRTMGERGRQRVLELYDARQVAAQMLGVMGL